MAKILVVDDEEGIRTIVSLALGDRHEVLKASNGREGVRAYEQYHPDLVIADLVMPVMNGIEMIRTIRGLSRKVKIIVLSTFHVETKEEIIKNGADICLSKPVDLNTLEKAVADLLSRPLEAEAACNGH